MGDELLMNVGMVTLGCSKNQVDSEMILGVFKELDFNDEMHPEYLKEMLKLMGINLRDAELYQAINQ